MKGESRSMHSTKTGHCATRVARPTKDHKRRPSTRKNRVLSRDSHCHEFVAELRPPSCSFGHPPQNLQSAANALRVTLSVQLPDHPNPKQTIHSLFVVLASHVYLVLMTRSIQDGMTRH